MRNVAKPTSLEPKLYWKPRKRAKQCKTRQAVLVSTSRGVNSLSSGLEHVEWFGTCSSFLHLTITADNFHVERGESLFDSDFRV